MNNVKTSYSLQIIDSESLQPIGTNIKIPLIHSKYTCICLDAQEKYLFSSLAINDLIKEPSIVVWNLETSTLESETLVGHQ